jgi:hypothetical protein
MAISHSARRFLATAVSLALALTACSHDNGPSEFNPDGMAADLGSTQTAFDSPAAASFTASGSAIATVLGSAAPAVVSPARALLHPAGVQGYATSLARLLPKANRINASAAAIPAGLLGTTFVWDLETQAYVASDLPGGPANGVRFLLYAVNPITGEPADPLNELGYVDVTDVSSGSVVATRILVFADGVTYLDYTASGSGNETSGEVTVSGFASNGTTRANFSLRNTISQTANGLLLTLDYSLAVPSRGFQIDYTATFGNISPQQVVVTLDFSISGRNGDVNLTGTYGASGGSFSVKVNGNVFATVTIGDGDPVITTASGTALTPQEEAAVRAVVDYYDGSLSVFDSLMTPVS